MNGFYKLASQGIAEGRTVEHEEEDEVVIQGNLSVMTFHQSKGLEFDVVIVRGLRAEIPPIINCRLLCINTCVWRIRPISAGPDVNTLRDFDSFRSYYVALSGQSTFLSFTIQILGKAVQTNGDIMNRTGNTMHGIVSSDPLMEVIP